MPALRILCSSILPRRCTNEPSALIFMRGVTVYDDTAYARKCPCLTYRPIFAERAPASYLVAFAYNYYNVTGYGG